jgi:sortase A
MLLGTLLIAGALLLFLRNNTEADQASKSSASTLGKLVEQMEATTPSEPTPVIQIPEVLLTQEDTQMDEVYVDELPCIGYLTIPKLELVLPILSTWDYDMLQVAPCRYYGSVTGNDLVLMAHNYQSHFGNISMLETDDRLFFTDVNGITIEYSVIAQDVLSPFSVEEMISGDFDLTLFTCTYGGQSRVTIYCDRV